MNYLATTGVKASFVLLVTAGLGTTSAWALPFLQLDAIPGKYDLTTQTTVATANPFYIRALINPSSRKFNGDGLTRDYFLSAAIIPGSQDSSFGTFLVDGMSVNSANMQYGTPPVESDLSVSDDPGDLSSHGIFPAFFAQFKFNIDPETTTPAYNVDPNNTHSGSGSLYYVDFLVDISGITSAFSVHFDLYDTVGIASTQTIATGKGKNRTVTHVTTTDIDVGNFAPFSHDAEGSHGITVIKEDRVDVPDGGTTAAMLGLSLLGLRFIFRRKD